jgi:hypothetical protein
MEFEIAVVSYSFQRGEVLARFYGRLRRKTLLPDGFKYGRYCGDNKDVEDHDEKNCDGCIDYDVGGKILMKMFLIAKYFETKMLKKTLDGMVGWKRIVLEDMIFLNSRREFLPVIRRFSAGYTMVPISYHGGFSMWRVTLIGDEGDTYEGAVVDGNLVLQNCCPDNEYQMCRVTGKKYWKPEF